MYMNNSVKIILIAVVFVACAAIGYMVMPSKKSDITTTVTGGGDGGGVGMTGPTPQPPITPPGTGSEPPVEVQPDSDSEPDSDQESEPEPEPEPANADAVPEIKSVVVGQRNSNNYKKIGVPFSIKATVASGDPLVYELYEIGGTTAKYTSNNGSFAEVYPVDGGKYLLKVVNKKTGDFAERQVAGFDKIKKYSSADLQAQLNVETTERLFYFHFDTDNLKFDCEGVDPSEKPTSLNALLSSRSANGWGYVVVGTPQYDKYNRITYFKVRVTE